jgi:tRNA A37 threonylcarbamoyladenosine modification protein TsaB
MSKKKAITINLNIESCSVIIQDDNTNLNELNEKIKKELIKVLLEAVKDVEKIG